MFSLESKLGQVLGSWGLVAVGVAVGLAVSPAFRKGARRLAVLATRGILSVTDEAMKATDEVKKAAGEAKGHLDKLVAEARAIGKEDAVAIEE